jgi:hypothetical protein
MLGASTAAYGLTLAGVAALQSQAEAAIAAARGPALEALDAGAAAHDDMAARLEAARRHYADAAAAYGASGAALDALHGELGDLAVVVGTIRGESRALPASVPLPVVRVSVPATRTPVTHATTRASGG